MSDYGKCSRKIKELDEVLTQNKINHYIHHYDKWSDLGALESRDYSDENKEKMFGMCFMSKCYTFYRGKLYVCPRAAHGERLGAFHNKENEYIDFNSNEGIMERKNKLKNCLKKQSILKHVIIVMVQCIVQQRYLRLYKLITISEEILYDI